MHAHGGKQLEMCNRCCCLKRKYVAQPDTTYVDCARAHISYSNYAVSEAAIADSVRLVNGKETRSISSEQIPAIDETPTTQLVCMERFVGLEWKCAVQQS